MEASRVGFVAEHEASTSQTSKTQSGTHNQSHSVTFSHTLISRQADWLPLLRTSSRHTVDCTRIDPQRISQKVEKFMSPS